MNGREIIDAIVLASTDDRLRSAAAEHAGRAVTLAFAHDHTRTAGKLRASDAGRCVREVWADIHGRYDLEQDPVTQISRFDIGTMYGVWLAALLKVELESREAGWRVALEPDLERHRVPGHADAIVGREVKGTFAWLTVVEFKSTYVYKNTGLPSDKRPHHCVQASHYALDPNVRASNAVVVTFAPAANPATDRLSFEDLDPTVWELTVDAEWERLAPALLEEMPPAEPRERWQCEGCRFGECELNRNPIKNALSISEV